MKFLIAKSEFILKYNIKNILDIIVADSNYKWEIDIKNNGRIRTHFA
jgi:hypothetical protein